MDALDADHELAAEWHSKETAPETVLMISLGALLLLGMCTQLMRQSAMPMVALAAMGLITLSVMAAWQGTLSSQYGPRP